MRGTTLIPKREPMPPVFRKEQSSKIFVLDDSPTLLAFVRMHLEGQGHSVFSFESPLGITREVIRHQPNLVIVDVKMPSITGDKVCRLIRGASAGRNVVILLHSSLPEEELRDLARRCDADGYLQKSHDPLPLIQVVNKRLKEAART